jgi:cellulose synthase/poly-beta-1,6-N-acetylglucosamine synthase-like glycosyltransferase
VRVRTARLGALAIGLLVLAAALVVVAVVLSMGRGREGRVGQLPFHVDYSVPAVPLLFAAVACVLAAAVGLAALEAATSMQVLARDRRIPDPLPLPLRLSRNAILGPAGDVVLRRQAAEELSSAAFARRPPPGPGTTVRCTVLIPAHDEEAVLGRTLDSLAGQTRTPDRVVVIADNCTDRTEEIARERGLEVITTVGNSEKKAGALNQVLARLLPGTDQHDVFLVMDADSTIAREYLEVGLGLLESDGDLMAVSGLFYGEQGGGIIGQCQRNEFARYQRYVSRSRNRVFVITGTASLFRACAFQAVADARGTLVPGPPGKVYDTLALTEDNELTLALKTLGARLVSPVECRVVTEVMPTWKALFRQRLRWHRGALENIGAYGFTRATAIYWLQQLALGYGVIALQSYFLLLTITLLAAETFTISWFWAAIGAVFVVERVVTAWREGWPGRLLAAPIFIELGYVVFLQYTFLTSLVQIVSGRQAGWNYVPREVGT